MVISKKFILKISINLFCFIFEVDVIRKCHFQSLSLSLFHHVTNEKLRNAFDKEILNYMGENIRKMWGRFTFRTFYNRKEEIKVNWVLLMEMWWEGKLHIFRSNFICGFIFIFVRGIDETFPPHPPARIQLQKASLTNQVSPIIYGWRIFE
jgi:hypothetical protein